MSVDAAHAGKPRPTKRTLIHVNSRNTTAMETKSIKLPGPNHPITIEPNPARVTVTVAGRVIADTRNPLTLRRLVTLRSSTSRKRMST